MNPGFNQRGGTLGIGPILLIANPHARNGRGRAKLQTLCRYLERRGVKYDLAACRSLEHATELSRAANREGRETIVAVGGDGTINRVLNGFYDQDGRRQSRARFGVVHVGTSPDFCKSYGVPTALEAAAETLLSGATRPITVGRVAWAPGAAVAPAFFGCCANAGLGAAVARGANGGIRRFAGDWLGTLLSLLRALARCRPRRVFLTLDGKRRELDGVYNIAIGKTRYIASGLQVRHALESQDRRLYVVCVRGVSLSTFAPALRAFYSGQIPRAGGCLSLAYAQRVEIEPAEAPLELEFDGDPAGHCPCRIETATEPLDLLVPAGTAGETKECAR